MSVLEEEGGVEGLEVMMSLMDDIGLEINIGPKAQDQWFHQVNSGLDKPSGLVFFNWKYITFNTVWLYLCEKSNLAKLSK